MAGPQQNNWGQGLEYYHDFLSIVLISASLLCLALFLSHPEWFFPHGRKKWQFTVSMTVLPPESPHFLNSSNQNSHGKSEWLRSSH